jgi:hypothetical protein
MGHRTRTLALLGLAAGGGGGRCLCGSGGVGGGALAVFAGIRIEMLAELRRSRLHAAPESVEVLLHSHSVLTAEGTLG